MKYLDNFDINYVIGHYEHDKKLELPEYVTLAIKYVKYVFNSSASEDTPFAMYLKIDGNERKIVIIQIDPALLESGAKKDLLFAFIRDLTHPVEVEWCYICSNAWAVEVPEKAYIPDISTHPDRAEVKVLHIEHKNMKSYTFIAPITVVNGIRQLGEFTKLPPDPDTRFKLFDNSSN